MLRDNSHNSGWRGACLVAITYIYFLIFAQFAFLKRLAECGIAGDRLKAVMAAMALGGVLLSLLTPRLRVVHSPGLRLRAGLLVSGTAAFLSLLPLSLAAGIAVAFLIGAGLGILTVTLATNLRNYTGRRNPLIFVGVGTGIGYMVCNLPFFFTASARVQAVSSGVLCLAALAMPLASTAEPQQNPEPKRRTGLSFAVVLACFAALVWLDSAAFFIIQNTPSLKAGTWQGAAHLWTNGLSHCAAALAGAWLLSRRCLWLVLAAAFAALGAACLLLLDPSRIPQASILYPIGVSLYSVALVAYPSLLAPSCSAEERGRRAGWIYAVAGWCGSAMGIGMGVNLGYVPPVFVLAAGLVIALPLLPKLLAERKREVALTALVALLALFVDRGLLAGNAPQQLSQVERGRQVYISEGCIHCHTQYVRPNTADVLLWGPAKTMQELRLQHPPLIGNRRQGPDLSQVGVRRSVVWLKAHFYNPAEVSGSSIMPRFDFLFRDHRGDDLVAYLASLHGSGAAQHVAEQRLWQPSLDAVQSADAAQGERLYQRDCANCHSADGHTRLEWRASFKRTPPDLEVGPFFYLPPSGAAAERFARLAQIAKFGVPGTDMPGHEYLSDKEIASITLWLSRRVAQP